MKSRFDTLIRAGGIALAFKVLLLVVALYAVYFHGLPKLDRLWLGVEILPMNDTIRTQFGVNMKGGVLINRVVEHSPAHTAGLKRGDVLLNIDNLLIYEAHDIRGVLKNRAFKDSVPVVYQRGGVVFSTKLILGYQEISASAGTVRSVYRYRLTLTDFCKLVILGLFAGTLSGLIGCGGGVLKVSLLIILFGFEIFLAKVVSLVSCGFMSMSSSYRYIRQGQVDKSALKYLIPSSIVGVVSGVGLSVLLDRHVLEVVLGLFLVYTALDVAYRIYADRREEKKATGTEVVEVAQRDPSVLVWAGFPLGVFSAVLGITGGIVGTSLQRLLMKAPIKTCIANTLVTVIFVSFLGGALLLIEGLLRDYFSFQTFTLVLLAIMPGSVIGGQLGARLNEELPINYIKGIYAVVVLFIAYKILGPGYSARKERRNRAQAQKTHSETSHGTVCGRVLDPGRDRADSGRRPGHQTEAHKR